jgi:HAD superfamily hydrolase (TIGR01549 family)
MVANPLFISCVSLCKNLTVIEAILFDLDGTLVDHRQAVLEAVSQVIAAFPGAETPPSVLGDTWWDLERTHMKRYLTGQCSFAEQRRQRLREFLPLLGEPVPEGEAELDRWFATNYLGAYEAAWRCYGDVHESLEVIGNLMPTPLMAVVTNGDFVQQHDKLQRFALLPTLGMPLTPTELGAAKPDPACFLAACHHFGVSARRTVYVGDWLEGDAAAASVAGLIGVWLDRGVNPVTGDSTTPEDCKGMPVIRIESLCELAPLIESQALGTGAT